LNLEKVKYNFRERKEKVEEILNNTDKVIEVDKFPRDEDFTYTNGYKAWTGSIFVDLRDSTSLFTNSDDVEISKVIRGFTSEIIEILRNNTDGNDLKEIGIRGDCVFAVYSTPKQSDTYEIANRAFYINTYIKMLNKLLEERGLPTIRVGIGLASQITLAVKAGRKSSGINNFVWIGEAVAKASKLSDLGNKNGKGPIVMSSTFYHNYIQAAADSDAKDWWNYVYDNSYGGYYHGNVVKSAFSDWIDRGMKE
jgi:class 3 adenylate cyclase